ncbi:xanthine dehydrogenase molybdopterin binding subunit [Methylomarinum vadi]|uniref:xanthine dehydrogenase molybdopterin binding subunit n=1 Tax=Methylomarinum vadi TaxID=438855 RepID=UPI0004DFCCD1|nr:molybdopterin cofactor-binding domain-containing protein [Methylomarinum vadi]
MKHADSILHAQGRARFADDIILPEGVLHGFPVCSSMAHARIKRCDFSWASAMEGVVAILSAADIPGINNIGNVEAEEVLLADSEVCYQGQPLALVVAESAELARQAASVCKIEYEALEAVFDPRVAAQRQQTIGTTRCFALGDVETAWQQCAVVVSGSAETGAQEHVYLETQTAIALPQENGQLKVVSATQSPGMVQRIIARVLDCPMHAVEVDVLRLGGAFGGKEEQATPWAVLVALAARRLQQPVKLHLSREEDMRLTGKRHPYCADFKIGLSGDGKILAYQVAMFQNSGASADLSPAILERSLFHVGGAYFIPNVHATAVCCRTHLPPNTAFRGFGAPQAMFILEAAIHQAALQMGVDPAEIQSRNLLKDGDHFPYGMSVQYCSLQRCYRQLQQDFDLLRRRQDIERFNAEQNLQKKGLALMPLAFGIAFTARFLNQADALVHIYGDGSVGISTGAVEMGQGVKVKLVKVAAQTLGIAEQRIKIESTNTSRIANMSPTAASTGADLNGQALRLACLQLRERLIRVAARVLGLADNSTLHICEERVEAEGQATTLDWRRLVTEAYLARCGLSAQAHYATPDLAFDRKQERGKPFAYHVYGLAAIEVTLDCLRGRYLIERADIIHDGAQSLDEAIDRGQIEGAVVQGLGWLTSEEIVYDDQGRLSTANLTQYKIPDIYAAPEIDARFLPDSDNPAGLLQSKAVGEPPFMYAIGGYFALCRAIEAFNPDFQPDFSAPMTPERVLMALHRQDGNGITER